MEYHNEILLKLTHGISIISKQQAAAIYTQPWCLKMEIQIFI